MIRLYEIDDYVDFLRIYDKRDFYRLNDNNKNKGLYKICCDYKLLEVPQNEESSNHKILVGTASANE